MQSIGLTVGEAFTMGVLFKLTSTLKPVVAFSITSGLLMIFGIFITSLVREHKSTKSVIIVMEKEMPISKVE